MGLGLPGAKGWSAESPGVRAPSFSACISTPSSLTCLSGEGLAVLISSSGEASVSMSGLKCLENPLPSPMEGPVPSTYQKFSRCIPWRKPFTSIGIQWPLAWMMLEDPCTLEYAGWSLGLQTVLHRSFPELGPAEKERGEKLSHLLLKAWGRKRAVRWVH